jgi:3-deoxy-D-manno-octulosonic-acid transferase
MYLFYSLLLAFAAVLSAPWWLLQMLRLGKYRAGLRERLGAVPPRLLRGSSQGGIWIHAVSVGEVLAVSQLVNEIRKAHPETSVFVSTTTATGQQLARQRFGEDRVFFMPFDFEFALRPYLHALRPGLLVLAETEFWPNLLHLARQSGAKIAVVNARISDRSFPRYRRFRWFFQRVLAPVDLFLAQTEQDARRLQEIGAPPEHVHVSGNLKFDIRLSSQSALVEDLRRAISQDSPVLVCGSTAEGEEEILLAAFRQVLHRHPAAVMVLAPRHPERFDRVAGLIGSAGLRLLRRSSWTAASPVPGGSVFLLDSVGELAAVYGMAGIAFVGGSLVPVGGHNILEPAQHGVAVLTGPHTFNFREIVRIFKQDGGEQGGGLRVVTAETLAQQLLDLLANPQQREDLGRRARQLFQENTGATGRTLQALESLMAEQRSAAS